jgi:hypothetical protein
MELQLPAEQINNQIAAEIAKSAIGEELEKLVDKPALIGTIWAADH